MSKGVEDLIEKKMKKANKTKKNVDLFNPNSDDKKNEKEKNQLIEDEDEDFIINTAVIDTKEMAQNQQQAIDLEKNIWEENDRVIDYSQQIENEKPKKKMAWGDNIKTTSKAAVIVDEYFPDLGDPNAKSRPKPKKQANNLLMTDDQPEGGVVKFTNSKGGSLNKFMQSEPTGPVYNENLGDDAEQKDAVIQLKGKIRLGYEESDAEKQRRKYIEELNSRAPVDSDTKQEGPSESEKPRFFNSKAKGNLGLFMKDDNDEKSPTKKESSKAEIIIENTKVSTQKWDQEENYVNEKRLFTNAKKKNAGLFQSEKPQAEKPQAKKIDSPKKVTKSPQELINISNTGVTLKGWD